MKSPFRNLLWLLALGACLSPSLRAGSPILLYPLARAFGSPSESELARCRQAFQGLQTRLGSSRVVVAPVYFVDGPRRRWRPDLADAITRELGAQTGANLEVAAAPPAVAPAELGHNQLRYLWHRAADYSGWVKAAHPAGDFVCCAEVWGFHGKVAAIHIFVLDASGQVAYCRLFNSHQFGNNVPLESDDAVRLMVKTLFRDLKREPTKVFPPYGVG